MPRMGESVSTSRPLEARRVSTIEPIASASVMPQLAHARAVRHVNGESSRAVLSRLRPVKMELKSPEPKRKLRMSLR